MEHVIKNAPVLVFSSDLVFIDEHFTCFGDLTSLVHIKV